MARKRIETDLVFLDPTKFKKVTVVEIDEMYAEDAEDFYPHVIPEPEVEVSIRIKRIRESQNG